MNLKEYFEQNNLSVRNTSLASHTVYTSGNSLMTQTDLPPGTHVVHYHNFSDLDNIPEVDRIIFGMHDGDGEELVPMSEKRKLDVIELTDSLIQGVLGTKLLPSQIVELTETKKIKETIKCITEDVDDYVVFLINSKVNQKPNLIFNEDKEEEYAKITAKERKSVFFPMVTSGGDYIQSWKLKGMEAINHVRFLHFSYNKPEELTDEKIITEIKSHVTDGCIVKEQKGYSEAELVRLEGTADELSDLAEEAPLGFVTKKFAVINMYAAKNGSIHFYNTCRMLRAGVQKLSPFIINAECDVKKIKEEKITSSIQDLIVAKKKELEESISKNKNDAELALEHYKSHRQKQMLNEASMAGFGLSKKAFKEKMIREIKMIGEIPEIKSVTFNIFNKKIGIYTKYLDLYDMQNNLYEGSEYKIMIDIKKLNITFDSDARFNGFWGEDDIHPHISGEGEACFGTASGSTIELLSEGELYALTCYLISFLKSANEEDSAGERGLAGRSMLDPVTRAVLREAKHGVHYGECQFCGTDIYEGDDYDHVWETVYISRDGEVEEELNSGLACENCLQHNDRIQSYHSGYAENIITVERCDNCSAAIEEDDLIAIFEEGEEMEDGNYRTTNAAIYKEVCNDCLQEMIEDVEIYDADGVYFHEVTNINEEEEE